MVKIEIVILLAVLVLLQRQHILLIIASFSRAFLLESARYSSFLLQEMANLSCKQQIRASIKQKNTLWIHHFQHNKATAVMKLPRRYF